MYLLLRKILLSAFTVLLIIFSITLNCNADSASESKAFISFLKKELFTGKPISEDSLSEYRTGHWSWNVSPIVRSYRSKTETTEKLVKLIEQSIPLSAEYNRHTDQEVQNDNKKREINRYYLDPYKTNRFRYFVKHFKIKDGVKSSTVSTIMAFELQVHIYREAGASVDTIDAYLFWRHL